MVTIIIMIKKINHSYTIRVGKFEGNIIFTNQREMSIPKILSTPISKYIHTYM